MKQPIPQEQKGREEKVNEISCGLWLRLKMSSNKEQEKEAIDKANSQFHQLLSQSRLSALSEALEALPEKKDVCDYDYRQEASEHADGGFNNAIDHARQKIEELKGQVKEERGEKR